MSFNLVQEKLSKSFTYAEYFQNNVEEIANTNPAFLDEEQLSKFNTKKLNLQRSGRIDKTYVVSDELRNIIESIIKPQLWMIISESWCGDSAQTIPYIAAAAKLNPNIDLRIILRDSNADVMDRYLTNGTRSIPILIAFDDDGNELFRWGPRPKAAQDLVNELKAQGLEKKEWLEKLHLWYARNKGVEIEKELIERVRDLAH